MSETGGTRAETYAIRRFESGDRDPYLDLYETVFGHRQRDAWFDWKYVHDPYVDHVPSSSPSVTGNSSVPGRSSRSRCGPETRSSWRSSRAIRWFTPTIADGVCSRG